MESVELGRRLVEARRYRGLTQAQLAQAAGMDRTALAKIESGQRRISALELGEIARELGRRMEWFVLPRLEAVTQYRRTTDDVGALAIDVILESAAADVALLVELSALTIPDRVKILDAPNSAQEAELLGIEARHLLQVANGDPAKELSEMVFRAGLVPFAEPLGDGADAASLIDSGHGVAVINSSMAVGRRRLALVHELGHFLINDQYVTDFRIDATDPDLHEARMDRFARSFLLPADAVKEAWNKFSEEYGARGSAIRIASKFRVDMATLSRRLKDDLGVIGLDEHSQIRAARTTQADIVELGLYVPHDLENTYLAIPFQRAVLQAYRAEDLSSSRALTMLRGTFMTDDLPELPKLNENNLWQVAT